MKSTRAVGNAIAQARRPPRVWLQASTATIYAHRYDAPNDEDTGLIGGQRPARPAPNGAARDLCQRWTVADEPQRLLAD